jgi:signal transduction histidine kinase
MELAAGIDHVKAEEMAIGEIATLSTKNGSMRTMVARSEEMIISEERYRISREIHGELAQNLAAIHMRMSVWRDLVGDDPERIRAEIETLRSLLGDSITQLKQLIFILRPIRVDEGEFYPALYAFTSDFAELSHVDAELKVVGTERDLPDDLERLLLRAIQETLHDAVRQARVRSIRIELCLDDPSQVILKISDDDVLRSEPALTPNLSSSRHSALERLEERIEQFDGSLSIRNEPRQGTVLEFIVPLSKFQED